MLQKLIFKKSNSVSSMVVSSAMFQRPQVTSDMLLGRFVRSMTSMTVWINTIDANLRYFLILKRWFSSNANSRNSIHTMKYMKSNGQLNVLRRLQTALRSMLNVFAVWNMSSLLLFDQHCVHSARNRVTSLRCHRTHYIETVSPASLVKHVPRKPWLTA